jgi:hypothetical protein
MPNRTIQPLQFGDEIIYIEVSDIEQQGETQQIQNRWQQVNALDKVRDAGTQVHATVKALCATMQSALKDAQPDEWTLELNLGFKGQAGIPFISQGEANGAVKVTAKWKKSVPAGG